MVAAETEGITQRAYQRIHKVYCITAKTSFFSSRAESFLACLQDL